MLGIQDVKRQFKKLQDRIFYDDILPPTGSQQISYARLIMLLGEKRVKRITLLSDGKVAIVEASILHYTSIPFTCPANHSTLENHHSSDH